MEKNRIVQGRNGDFGGSFDLFKVKSFWNEEGGIFSWPPRSYTCSFCRREFRSAQALGGHMNVHRRDRARLRLSPAKDEGELSLIRTNGEKSFNSNPNPSFLNPLNHMNEAKVAAVEKTHVGGEKGLFLLKKIDLWEEEKDCEMANKEEELDLELRLGFSSYMK